MLPEMLPAVCMWFVTLGYTLCCFLMHQYAARIKLCSLATNRFHSLRQYWKCLNAWHRQGDPG